MRSSIWLRQLLRVDVLAAFMVGFVVVAAVYALFFILPVCRGDNCTIQGWLSALSGWVAAAAAIVTLLILIRQVDTQNRQVKFLLGENPPVAELWETYLDNPVVRITNWNRTKFEIAEVFIDAPFAVHILGIDTRSRDMLNYYPIMESEYTVSAVGQLNKKIVIPGWENQNEDPSEIFIAFDCRAIISDRDSRESHAVIDFFGHLSGRNRVPTIISVETTVGNLVTRRKE